jgi:hypothetical protein
MMITFEVLMAFGFFFMPFDFAGWTVTETEQLPGLRVTNLPPETLQIFFDDPATFKETFAFAGTAIPSCAATAPAETFALTPNCGAGAGAGAGAGGT